MTSVVDPKAYWDLLETVWWIRSRDEEWVANMQDKSEEDKASSGLVRPQASGEAPPASKPPGSGIQRCYADGLGVPR
jgi:hypothetical protein